MYTATIKHPNKSHPKFVGKDREKIIKLYESGMSAQEVADRMNADKKTILHLLHQEGIIRTAAESKTLDLPKEEIVRLYVEDGLSAREIGKQFGTDAHIILNRLRLWNIKIIRNRKPLQKHIDIEAISKMYDNGMSTQMIASVIGVSSSVIQRRLHDANADLPIGRPQWKPLSIETITEKYESGLSADVIATEHDCSCNHILNKLHDAGIDTCRTGFGHPAYTANGECVRSSLELFVANWLHSNDIHYEYEPKIADGRHRADFKVGDYFIEVCGITRNVYGYDDRLRAKEKLYERQGLDYVLLFPSAINDADLHKTFSQPWILNSIKETYT